MMERVVQSQVCCLCSCLYVGAPLVTEYYVGKWKVSVELDGGHKGGRETEGGHGEEMWKVGEEWEGK